MVNYKESVQSLKLDGLQVVVAGGSNGIGKALAKLYVSKGASVAIIGRSSATGEATLKEMGEIAYKNADKGPADQPIGAPRIKFIQADLSLVSNVREAAEKVKEWAGKKRVDILLQTQGVAPPAKPEQTSEGFEVYFATQILSRFALPYFLFENNTLHPESSTVANIALAGSAGSYKPSLEDIDLSKRDKASPTGFGERTQNSCAVMDAYLKQFSIEHPSAKFYHFFPGIVRTSVISGATNTPFFIKAGAAFLNAIPGATYAPADVATMVAHVITVKGADNKELTCWNEKGKVIPLSAFANDEKSRKAVWDQLVKTVGAGSESTSGQQA